jgi:protein-L-isoaspartate O-methyltransferase
VVPVDEDDGGQVLLEIQRSGQTFAQRKLMAVSYVPLVRQRREL